MPASVRWDEGGFLSEVAINLDHSRLLHAFSALFANELMETRIQHCLLAVARGYH